MVVSEQDRRELHQRPVDVVGRKEADLLMEHLPPVGWADVATRRDLDHLGTVLRSEIRADIATLEVRVTDKLTQAMRVLVLSMIGLTVTAIGSVVGAAALH